MALTAKHREPELEVVSLDDLNVDHSYQRPLSDGLVEKILADWDPIAADALTVSRRKRPSKTAVQEAGLRGDGSLWLVNGQHEAMAAKLAGESEMLAFVHEGMTVQEEADLRLKKNNRRSDTPMERFHAQIRKGVPETLAIVALLEKYETHPNRTANAHTGVNAVSTLEVLYRDDPEVFERTLRALKTAHGELKGDVVTATPLRGVHWFLKVHLAEYHWKSFIERMGQLGYDELKRRAMSHKSVARGADWLNYYRALVEMYNYKRPEHTRLELKTKYSGSISSHPSERALALGRKVPR